VLKYWAKPPHTPATLRLVRLRYSLRVASMVPPFDAGSAQPIVPEAVGWPNSIWTQRSTPQDADCWHRAATTERSGTRCPSDESVARHCSGVTGGTDRGRGERIIGAGCTE
jgi:hypothetical protein